jgi:hypothetical protein
VSLLTAVDPERLHDVWPWVKTLLDRLYRKAERRGRRPDWLPEDVYASVKSAQAVLFVVGQDEGILVLQRQVRAYGPLLFIWIVVGAGLKHYEQELYAEIESIARRGGMRRIQGNSSFPGWGQWGWLKPVETVYEREVT